MGMNYDRIKEWILSEDSFDADHLGKCEAVMSLGNGYMGLRSALEERYLGETRDLLVNGCFDRFDESEVTELPNIPDFTAVEIWVNGARFSLDQGRHRAYCRQLNLYTGELTRRVIWSSDSGDEVLLTFRRIVSLRRIHDAAMQISVTPLSGPLTVKLRSGINAQVTNTGTQHFIEGEKRFFEHKYLQFVEKTVQSGIDVVVNATHRFFKDELPADAGRLSRKIAAGAAIPEPPGETAAPGEGAGLGSRVEVAMETDLNIDRRILYADYTVDLAQGETFTLEKYANVNTSRDLDWAGVSLADMQVRSLEDLKLAAAQGYDTLAAESAAQWEAEVWSKAPVSIEGAEGSETDADYDLFSLRFAQYHMRVMLPRHDARMNIGAKGLSGEGYKGHCFWDTEIFLLPYYIFTDPQAARNLVKYRYLSLPGAHRKAKENGYAGAMFPWESAWLDDGETCPAYMGTDIITGTPIKVWSGIIEQHITADVAFGVWQYVTASGDQEFMDEYGYEVIMDAANFWASRLENGTWGIGETAADIRPDGKYHINDAVGPDEYHEHVNDNAFTNYMACWNLKKAIEYADLLDKENPALYEKLDARLNLKENYPKWVDGAANIYLPQPTKENILPMDDRFMQGKYIDLTKYKEQPFVAGIMKDYNLEQIQGIQVCKQADCLVLFFLLEELFPAKVKKASWDYYIERTLHDSSLSLSTHSVMAADMGETELAYDLFRQSAAIDLGPYMGTSDAGIHAASFGGVWQGVVYGFGGLRMIGGELHFRPHLPEKWKKLNYRILWKGEELQVTITKETITVANLTTEAVPVTAVISDLPEGGLVI